MHARRNSIPAPDESCSTNAASSQSSLREPRRTKDAMPRRGACHAAAFDSDPSVVTPAILDRFELIGSGVCERSTVYPNKVVHRAEQCRSAGNHCRAPQTRLCRASSNGLIGDSRRPARRKLSLLLRDRGQGRGASEEFEPRRQRLLALPTRRPRAVHSLPTTPRDGRQHGTRRWPITT